MIVGVCNICFREYRSIKIFCNDLYKQFVVLCSVNKVDISFKVLSAGLSMVVLQLDKSLTSGEVCYSPQGFLLLLYLSTFFHCRFCRERVEVVLRSQIVTCGCNTELDKRCPNQPHFYPNVYRFFLGTLTWLMFSKWIIINTLVSILFRH